MPHNAGTMPALAAARQPDDPNAPGWFSLPLAQRLLREEQRQAAPLLTACYGQVGLYLRGDESAPPELSGNLMQCVLRLHRRTGLLAGDLTCDDNDLPIQRESLDLVYLLHGVEGCAQPRLLFTEIERVLTPEGTLMLVALNPYSLWRARWAGSGLRAMAMGRCRNGLLDAGFEIVQQRGLGPMLPWLRDGLWHAMPDAGEFDLWSVWRASYLIQARKRRRGMTPVRRRAVALQPGIG